MRASVAALTGALLLALFAGCTVGRLYRGNHLRADPAVLVEGESTKSDVLRLFGPPDHITHLTDGDAFVYLYTQRNFSSITLEDPIFTGIFLFNFNRQFDMRDKLVVLFDYTGIVRGVGFDHQTGDMPTL